MYKTENCQIQSISLANTGRREIESALATLPGLTTLSRDYQEQNLLENVKIVGCLTLDANVGAMIEELRGQGAIIQWASDKTQNTSDTVAAALVQNQTANVFAWKGQKPSEYIQSIKRALVFPDQKGPDLIIDDMGVISELIHTGVDAEKYFEQYKRIPDLVALGVIKQQGWSSLFTASMFGGRKTPMSASRAEYAPYYQALNTIIGESLQQNPKFFHMISQNIVGATDNTIQGRYFFKRLKPEKLLYTPLNSSSIYASLQGQFGDLLSSLIPDVIKKVSNNQIRGKIIIVIGFGNIGQVAAIALRDIGGAKVVICESDPKAATKASMHQFQVKDFELIISQADFVLITGKQKITLSQMEKMKSGCTIGTLEVEPEIETGLLNQIPRIQIEQVIPGLDKYSLPTGKCLYLIQEAKPLNLLSGGDHLPLKIATHVLCSQILCLFDLWINKEKYPKIVTLTPQYVIEKTVLYAMHSEHIELTKGYESPDEEFFEKKFEVTAQGRERGSTIYISERLELEKLKAQIQDKEKQFKRQAMKELISDQPLKDLHLGVDIGNDYLTQVQLTLNSYKQMIESLKNMKMERVDLWRLIEKVRQNLKYQYKSVKDVGTQDEISQAKKIIKHLEESTENITVQDSQKVHFQALTQYLEVSHDVSILNDKSQAKLRDLQFQTLKDLPACEGQRYETQIITHYAMEEVTDQSCLDIRRRRILRDSIMYLFEVAKQHALQRNSEEVQKTLQQITPKLLELTGNKPVDDKVLQDIQSVEQAINLLDSYCNGQINPDVFKNELISYDTLKKIVFLQKEFCQQLEDANQGTQDVSSQMMILQDEVDKLNELNWSLGQRILKPAIIKSSTIEVKAGADEQEPAKTSLISPEMLEGYAQSLNKIIQGQTKNIRFLGGEPTQILEKVPSEQDPVLTRLPKQIAACIDLNKFLNGLQNNLQKESQKTLCLLTNEPNLNHNLFDLELDKRDIINKKFQDKDQNLNEMQQMLEDLRNTNDDLGKQRQQLRDELNKDNKNILEFNQQLDDRNKQLADKDKEIADLQNQVNDLKEQLKKLKNDMLADMNKILNELKKISVPLEAESEVQNAIIQRLLQTEDKENTGQQIEAGVNAALEACKQIRDKESQLLKDSKFTYEKLLQYKDIQKGSPGEQTSDPKDQSQVPEEIRLFQLEKSKQDALEDLLDSYKQLLDDNDKLGQENKNFKQQIDDQLKQLEDMTEKDDSLLKEKEDLKQKLEDLQKLYQELLSDNEAKEFEIERLKEAIKGLEKELEDFKKLYFELQEKSSDAEAQNAQVQVTIRVYQVKFDELQEKYKLILLKLQEKERLVDELQRQLIDEKMKYQKLQSDQERKLCEKDAEIQSRDQEIQLLKKQIEQMQDQEEKIKDDIVNLKTQLLCEQEEVERMKEVIKDLQEQLQNEKDRELRRRLIQLEEENKELLKQLEEMKQKLKRLKELEAQVIKLECINGSLIKELEILRPIANDYQRLKHLTKHLEDELEKMRKQLAEKIDIVSQEGAPSQDNIQLKVQNRDLALQVEDLKNAINDANQKLLRLSELEQYVIKLECVNGNLEKELELSRPKDNQNVTFSQDTASVVGSEQS